MYGKRKKLAQAFDILKVQKGGRLVVTYTVWCELMKRVIPNRSRSHIDLLIRVLDIDGSKLIREFILNSWHEHCKFFLFCLFI